MAVPVKLRDYGRPNLDLATSATSLLIAVTTKVFTTQSGRNYRPGTYVLATSRANPTVNQMLGMVMSYAGTTLTLDVQSIKGSGTYADWDLQSCSAPGATGPQGLPGGVYASTALGIAATTNGQLFLVQGANDVFANLYKNVSGVATDQGLALPSKAYTDAILNKLEGIQTIGRAVACVDGTVLAANTFFFRQPATRSGYIRSIRYFGKAAGTAYIRLATAVGDDLTIVKNIPISISTGAQVQAFELYVPEGQYVGIYAPNLIPYSTGLYSDELGFWRITGDVTTTGTGTQVDNLRIQLGFDISYQGVNYAEVKSWLDPLRKGIELVQTIGRPFGTTLVTDDPISSNTVVYGDVARYDGWVRKVRYFGLNVGTMYWGVFTISGNTKTTSRFYPIEVKLGYNEVDLDVPILAGQTVGFYACVNNGNTGLIAYSTSLVGDGLGCWNAGGRLASYSDSTLSTAFRCQISWDLAYILEPTRNTILAFKYPGVIEEGFVYIPALTWREGELGSAVSVAPSDGSLYWKIATPSPTTGYRIFFSMDLAQAGSNPIILSSSTGQPLYATRRTPEIVRVYNGVYSSLHKFVGGASGEDCSRNIFTQGNDPDNALYFSSTATIVDIVNTELNAAGINRGVTSVNSYATYGMNVERTDGNSWISVRLKVLADRDDAAWNFSAAGAWGYRYGAFDSGVTTYPAELEEIVTTRVRYYRVNAKVTYDLVRWLFGIRTTNADPATYIVGGIQFASKKEGPVGWIYQNDYDKNNLGIGLRSDTPLPILSKNMRVVDGTTVPLYLESIVRLRDKRNFRASLSFTRTADNQYPYELSGDQRFDIDTTKIPFGTSAAVLRTWKSGEPAGRKYEFPLTFNKVPNIGLAKAPNVLFLWDSIGNRRMLKFVEAFCLLWGVIPNFIGSIRTSNVDGSTLDATGPWGECRESRSIGGTMNLTTNTTTSTPLPLGDEGTYAAGSKSVRVGYNPMLRPPHGTSTASSIAGAVLTVGGTLTGVYRPGQVISGSGVTLNTKILVQLTGSVMGGAGTYSIDTSQTVASTSIAATDPAGTVNNGQVFDFGYYVYRLSNAGMTSVSMPDIMFIMLGTNDWTYDTTTRILTNLPIAIPRMADSIFEAKPTMKLVFGMPGWAEDVFIADDQQRWAAMMPEYLKQINAYKVANPSRDISCLSAWAHMSPYSDWALDAGSVDPLTGSRYPWISDSRHPLGTPRSQGGLLIASALANLA